MFTLKVFIVLLLFAFIYVCLCRFLELTSLCSFLNSYCNCYSHTNHWVVTCTDQTHHLNVSRYR